MTTRPFLYCFSKDWRLECTQNGKNALDEEIIMWANWIPLVRFSAKFEHAIIIIPYKFQK